MGKNTNQQQQSQQEEAIRLKILAEEKFNSSNLTAALEYANRAHRLCPTVDGVAEMATAFRILRAAADAAKPDSDPDWYKILDLEPFSHINSIRKQYKNLSLILHPDKNSLEASGEAFKLVNSAFQVLSDRVRRKEFDMKLRVSLQAETEEADAAAEEEDAFSTNCSHCRLLHRFERKYVGQSLVCPSCRNSFKAVEVLQDEGEENGARRSSRIRVSSAIGGEKKTDSTVKRKNCSINGKSETVSGTSKLKTMNGSSREEKDDDKEMTLAEMRLKLKKKKSEGSKKAKVREVKKKEERMLVLRSEDMEVMKVEDSDFHDFDKDRGERSFKHGQVWAIYDDDDGMPRHYGLIEEVVSVNPFEVKMSWLDLQNNGDQSLVSWEGMGLHVSCGRFKVSREDNINLVNVFSHMVICERVAREIYRIFPHKGSVWALYKLEEFSEERIFSKRCYEIAVFLTSYSEMHGISLVYLEKVDGFRTVFRRKDTGHRAVRWIEKFDFRQFSHQIPARKLCDDDVPDNLKDCWELDPAALPQDLLAIEPLS